jgi:molybdopterin-guanine dinucleotide biosynthesis protein MobB
LMPVVIPVVGGKKSGKTATIELLVKELARRGYRVAVAKHIPEPNFTIDTRGKDTWRFAEAGAKTIVAVSPSEVAVIEKVQTGNFSVDDILRPCSNSAIVFLEGFRRLIAAEKHLQKIAVVKSASDAREAVKTFERILAFTGSYNTERDYPAIPYVDVSREPNKLADIIELTVKKGVVT